TVAISARTALLQQMATVPSRRPPNRPWIASPACWRHLRKDVRMIRYLLSLSLPLVLLACSQPGKAAVGGAESVTRPGIRRRLSATPAEGCFDDSIFAEPVTGARSARLQPAGPGGDKRCGSGEPRRHAAHAEPTHRQELPDAGYRNAGGGRRRPARPEHRRPR